MFGVAVETDRERAARRSPWPTVASGEDRTAEVRESLAAIRPATRSDCRGGLRPCPFVGCGYHALHARIFGTDGRPPVPLKAALAGLDARASCLLDEREGWARPASAGRTLDA